MSIGVVERDRALALACDLIASHHGGAEPVPEILRRHGIDPQADADARWAQGWRLSGGWSVYFDPALALYRVAPEEQA